MAPCRLWAFTLSNPIPGLAGDVEGRGDAVVVQAVTPTLGDLGGPPEVLGSVP